MKISSNILSIISIIGVIGLVLSTILMSIYVINNEINDSVNKIGIMFGVSIILATLPLIIDAIYNKELNEDICKCGHHSKDHSYNPNDTDCNLECDKCNCKNFEPEIAIVDNLNRKNKK